MTTIRVPISLGVDAIEGVEEMMGVQFSESSYTSGLIETVHTRVPQPQMSTIRFMPDAPLTAKHQRFAVSLTCKSNLNKLCQRQNNPSQCTDKFSHSFATTHRSYINRWNRHPYTHTYTPSLSWYVRFPILENEMGFPTRQIQQHFGKVAVRPCKPWSHITRIIDGHRLMN